MEKNLELRLNKTDNSASILREFGKRDICLKITDYPQSYVITMKWQEFGYHYLFFNNLAKRGICVYKLDEGGNTIDEFMIPLAEIDIIYSL